MLQVKALRDNGCSLEEIKNYQCNAREIFLHPRKRMEELRREIASLEFALQCQKTYLSIYKYLAKTDYERFVIRDVEEGYFFCTPVSWEEKEEDLFLAFTREYNKHLDRFQNLDLPYSYLEGICTSFSGCEEPKKPPLLITKVFQNGDGDDFFIRPQGRYLSMLHKGRLQDRPQIIERFQRYMTERGLSAADNRFYCFEMLNYVEDPESPEDVYAYEIRVE